MKSPEAKLETGIELARNDTH